MNFVSEACEQALKRLRVDYLDLYFCHRPDPETPLEETLGAVAAAVKQGKALYAGISNYTAEQTRDACGILRNLGAPCLIHQPKYSMFERWVEDGLLDVLEKEGVGCIPWSPLARGLLAGGGARGGERQTTRAGTDPFLHSLYRPDLDVAVIDRAAEVATERGVPTAQVALAWLLHKPGVTAPIVGATRLGHLEDALAAEQLRLSDEEVKRLEEPYVPHPVSGIDL